MNRFFSRLGFIAVALVAGSGVVAQAQDTGTPEFFFKLRGQAGVASTQGLRNGMGMGAGANLKFGAGKLGLELSYLNNPGKIFRADIPANTIGDNQSNSVFTQKHQANMLGVRGSYSMPLEGGWSWQAGLGLYRAKASMESIGDFQAGTTVDGTWTSVTEKSSICFQPFGGVSYKFPEAGSLEFNLVFSSYKTPDVTASFTPAGTSYNRVKPVFGDKTVSNLRLEINYVFHF